MNKYFWPTTEDRMEEPPIGSLEILIQKINIRNKPHSRHAYKRIADLTSIRGLLSYLILEDVLIYNFVAANFTHFTDFFLCID